MPRVSAPGALAFPPGGCRAFPRSAMAFPPGYLVFPPDGGRAARVPGAAAPTGPAP